MADYIPAAGPLPGEQYIPSNSTDGSAFLDLCADCARDACLNGTKDEEDCGDDDFCPIVAASFRGEAVEWRELPDGKLTCIAFVPMGQAVPGPRCAHTQDLFGSET
jgi:hypothetical protein